MSKPVQATPDAELVLPWEKTPDQRETEESAEKSLFELLGSDPEFAEKGSRKREDEDPENEDGPHSEDSDEEDEERTDTEDSGEEDEEFEYEEDEDDEGGEEDEDGDLHVVKVDGEEIEVEYDELLAGYSRTEYMTRKRQEESAAHRTAMAEVSQARTEYQQKLELMEQALDQLSPAEPDWEKIQRDNPDNFGAIFAAHQKRKEVREAIAKEKAAEAERTAEAQAQELEVYVAEQMELLTNAVPAWKKDQAKMAEEIGEISEFAINTLGFTKEEMATVSDHRVILALRAAKRGIEMEQGGKKALRKKKRRTLRPSGKKRGETSKTGRRRKRSSHKKRQERVARTGRVQDAADLFNAMLEDGADL